MFLIQKNAILIRKRVKTVIQLYILLAFNKRNFYLVLQKDFNKAGILLNFEVSFVKTLKGSYMLTINSIYTNTLIYNNYEGIVKGFNT